MMVRRIARPLFAAWFVSEGLDAARRPDPHVARTTAAWQSLGGGRLPDPVDEHRLRQLVRAHGVLMAVAAFLLAVGRAPRTSGLVLAGLTVPLAVVNQPFGRPARVVATASEAAEATSAGRKRFGRPIGATGGVGSSVRPGGADRAVIRERFLRNLTMIGGALLAAADTQGRPGLAWRV
ncbi:DoxX family membrane protein, partial [Actinotalea sp. JY-7885]